MASRTAVRRSKAPACAPCHSIANSPDTLYTASGCVGCWTQADVSQYKCLEKRNLSILVFVLVFRKYQIQNAHLILNLPDNIKIRQSRFHHQHIGSFFYISLLKKQEKKQSLVTKYSCVAP